MELLIFEVFIIFISSISALNVFHSNAGSGYCKNNRICTSNGRWSRHNIENVEIAPCYCDKECVNFKDCCIDFRFNEFLDHKKFICVGDGLAEPVYLLQSCPSVANPHLKALCEKPNAKDLFTLLPTTSIQTNITYRNSFCAICNKERTGALKLWNPVISCSSFDGNSLELEVTTLRMFTRFNAKKNNWEYKPLDLFLRPLPTNVVCNASFSVPPWSVKSRIKKCKPNINTCHPSWNDNSMEEKCNSYTAYVYSNRSITYKNIYCAVCNMINIEELACDPRDTTYKLKNAEIQNILNDLYIRGQYLICRTIDYYSHHPIHPPCPPGTILQNIGFEVVCLPQKYPILEYIDPHSIFGGNVCTLNFVFPVGSSNRFSSQYCPLGNVFDPFIRQCRIVRETENKIPAKIVTPENASTIDEDYSEEIDGFYTD